MVARDQGRERAPGPGDAAREQGERDDQRGDVRRAPGEHRGGGRRGGHEREHGDEHGDLGRVDREREVRLARGRERVPRDLDREQHDEHRAERGERVRGAAPDGEPRRDGGGAERERDGGGGGERVARGLAPRDRVADEHERLADVRGHEAQEHGEDHVREREDGEGLGGGAARDQHEQRDAAEARQALVGDGRDPAEPCARSRGLRHGRAPASRRRPANQRRSSATTTRAVSSTTVAYAQRNAVPAPHSANVQHSTP